MRIPIELLYLVSRIIHPIQRIALRSSNHFSPYAALIRGAIFSYRFTKVGRMLSLGVNVKVKGTPLPHIVMGNRVALRDNVLLIGNGRLTVGDRSVINDYSIIACYDNVSIGCDVMIAPHVYILDVSHTYARTDVAMNQQEIATGRVEIQDDVWVGAYSVILKGVTIGKGAIIGAHSLVTRDVPEYTVVGGIPARQISCRRPSGS